MFKKMGLNLDTKMLEDFNNAKSELKLNNLMMRDYEMSKTEKLEM